ncbi:MAG: ArsR family transcriptional regulator [Ktedonobacteraceae bacterium]|nr:ArsR family transcriptional regulator [Ktedonobacteraceae bacterium]
MQAVPWKHNFFASTRGQILVLLRRASSTVDEIAQALHVTDNAIRVHLAALERDGLVRQCGVRRAHAKPAYVYELTAEAENLFPKAYSFVLDQLLEALKEYMEPETLEALMRTVGQRLATQWKKADGDIQQRLQRAVGVLNEFGGLAELEQEGERYLIRGYRCPLAAVVPENPQVCHLVATLLTEIVDVPVQERCQGGEIQQCCFVLSEAQ